MMAVPWDRVDADGILVQDDVNFARARLAGQPMDLRCSVYLPGAAETPPPLFVWYHGGSFKFGNHAQRICRRVGRHLAKRGIAVVSAQYRLRATFEDLSEEVKPHVHDLLDRRRRLIRPGLSQERALAATEDGAALLHWADARAQDYGWSAKRIVGGVSAGGVLAFNLAFTAPELGLRRAPLDGVFASSGGYDFPHLVHKDAVGRVLALHNPSDDRVSINGVRMLERKLGARMRLMTSDRMMHGKLELTEKEKPRVGLRRLARFVHEAAGPSE